MRERDFKTQFDPPDYDDSVLKKLALASVSLPGSVLEVTVGLGMIALSDKDISTYAMGTIIYIYGLFGPTLFTLLDIDQKK
jgi:hypothetical protein